jgi:hypothetical protein
MARDIGALAFQFKKEWWVHSSFAKRNFREFLLGRLRLKRQIWVRFAKM